MNGFGVAGGLVGGLNGLEPGFRIGFNPPGRKGLFGTTSGVFVGSTIFTIVDNVPVGVISFTAVELPTIVVTNVFGAKVDVYSEVIVSGESRV